MATEQLVDQDVLREAIRGEYEEVANHPTKGFHFHVGRVLADRVGYPDSWLEGFPEEAIESFAGVGNPFAWGELKPGEVVLDLGSGSGFDCILAAQQVGPDGKVIGIDMTPAMNAKARTNAATLGLAQAEFHEGYLEALPINDDSIDVIISNGVINLCPDKASVLAEAYRVLKPGGRLQISDIIVQREVPESAQKDIDLWTGWIAGALPEAAMAELIRNAGFEDVRFSDERYDTFSDAPSASSADAFGTQGVNIWAVKPENG